MTMRMTMSRDPALETFLAECAELLGVMEGVLLQCEQGSSGEEAVNELFRAAHTVKGSAGLFGLDSIVAFTHVVESVLDRARAGRLPISGGAAAILLECTDHIGQLVASVAAGEETVAAALLESGSLVLERLMRLQVKRRWAFQPRRRRRRSTCRPSMLGSEERAPAGTSRCASATTCSRTAWIPCRSSVTSQLWAP